MLYPILAQYEGGLANAYVFCCFYTFLAEITEMKELVGLCMNPRDNC